ncbi:hypothetical protein HY065_01810 [Candidatus Berkelbacteria bacterium]|nr:hypothetical protein [Candidatus Berkelbacteria bacterium]
MVFFGVGFPDVYNASGARNFDGNGYWYRPFVNWGNAGFIAKTTTLEPRLDPTKKFGNMPLKSDGITPEELLPKCIRVNIFTGEALNAVGLSGPGAHKLLELGFWQNWNHGPFFLSFMSVEADAARRLEELQQFIALLVPQLQHFKSPVGLQVNFSCPNVGLDLTHLVGEIHEALEICNQLRQRKIPIIVKLNPMVPRDAVIAIANHKFCDGVAVNNTIPWGSTDRIDWRRIFGSHESPLAHLGGGGYSGRQALPIVCELIRDCIAAGVSKPLIGGNGIQSVQDAGSVIEAGASAIELGVIGMIRPWRMAATI